MATINGITIKNVKTFSGIEYPTCTECTVYDGKKRIGSYCEDQWGGSGHFSPSSIYKDLKPYAEKYKAGCKNSQYYEFSGDPEVLLEKIIRLHNYEKDFKRNVKNGYMATVFFYSDYLVMAYGFRQAIDENNLHPSIIKNLKKNFPKENYQIWQVTDPNSFDIIIDEDHPIPSYLV